jgi:hypothetical protein
MLTDLTPVELKLIDAARRGEVLECSDLDHDQLRVTKDPALLVRGEVVRELLLGRHGELDPRGILVQGARIIGEIDLRYVTATQGLGLNQCVFDNPARLSSAHLPRLALTKTYLPGVEADGMLVDGNVNLNDAVVSGEDTIGVVALQDAHINGGLFMRGAQLTNGTGPALDASRLKVDGSVDLTNGFTAVGTGDRGAVCLIGAQFGGQIGFSRAQLTNNTGPALNAAMLKIDGDVFLNGFTAIGAGEHGVVRFLSAHIGDQLNLTGAKLISPGRALLDLRNARLRLAFLPPDLFCPQRRTTSRTCPNARQQFTVDGFVYTEIYGIHSEWRQWLHLLRCHTPSYTPMPYQQLAAIRTAAGHDRDARRILIVQQQDHRARGDIGGPLRRAAHMLWGALAGYGYRTGRTALALLIVLLLAGGMGWWAGHTETAPGRHAAEHPNKFTACSPVELIGLGIDRGLPLASTGIRARCDLDTSSNAGQWFTVAIWLLQAAVWALATLALAGYTGLVRKIR